MKRLVILGGIFALACFTGYAQSDDPKVTFEVASVKPSQPLDSRSGPARKSGGKGQGSADPGRYARQHVSLAMLIQQAYNLKAHQVVGPSWLTTELYDITAKVPEGATPEQLNLMLRNLLAERFGLKVHRDRKEMPTFDLVIAKGGSKMKEWVETAADAAAPTPSSPFKVGKDADGFPVLPPGAGAVMVGMNGRNVIAMNSRVTMEQFCGLLTLQSGRPVNDATALKGKYEVVAHWVMDTMAVPADAGSAPAAEVVGPGLAEALPAQLGLRLEAKKAMVDVLVIDHAEKVPTEN